MPEHHSEPAEPEPSHTLKRGLSQRHIQRIAISGALGTGFFMGSGKTSSLAGPCITVVYMIVGAFIYPAMHPAFLKSKARPPRFRRFNKMPTLP